MEKFQIHLEYGADDSKGKRGMTKAYSKER